MRMCVLYKATQGCIATPWRKCVLQSDAEMDRNYIAANIDAHVGNPSHLTHNATNPNAQCTAPQYSVGCQKKIGGTTALARADNDC